MSITYVETNETSLPLDLTIDEPGVGGVVALSPTVAIRNILNGSYLDWSTMTFKTSGWITKNQLMSEIGNGFYETILNIAALELSVGIKLSAEYNTNSTILPGVDADLFILDQEQQQINFLRKMATNRLEEKSGDPGSLTLYDDDDVTVIETWELLDEAGGPVLPAIGTPAKRSAASP